MFKRRQLIVLYIVGNVIGGGAELLLSCDFAIANPNTKIFFVQVSITS